MKFVVKTLLLVSLLIGAGLIVDGSQYVSAQEPRLDEAHEARIREKCPFAKTTLRQLHTSDTGLRVNRGQLYEAISTKLMATFNGRLTLNRLDGGDLDSIASTYDENLREFREAYTTYEQAMTSTLGIDCFRQPSEFYYSVANAREKRQELNKAVKDLNLGIVNYKKSFETFAESRESRS